MKKTLKQYCNEVDVWEAWRDRYKQFVPQFINEAITKTNWEDWDKTVFFEFFERSNNQCVSSLKQGYFTKEEQQTIKSNWSELAPLLKIIAQNQDNPQWETYQQVKKLIRSLTVQDRRAATNRLIASLQPKLLCTIVNKNHLWELFDKLKRYSSEILPDFIEDDWFINSHNICCLFQKVLQPQNAMDIITFPWEVLEHLRYVQEKQIDMNTYIDAKKALVEINKNLIFTGAPGTGKTYLAKQIAKSIIGVETDEELEKTGQFAFVQFHPSYDYTDFVEGLRPTKPDDNGNIGFELKNGIFKSFCTNALMNFLDSRKSKEDILLEKVFEKKYNDLLDAIQNEEINRIPLKTNGKHAEIYGVSDNGNIVFRKTDGSPSSNCISISRLKLLANKYRTKNSLYNLTNINQSIREIIGGCNATWYWATLSYIYDKFGDLSLNNSDGEEIKQKKYVFIIDEINRGEISKIFGELFFSIDPGYRGEKGIVQTQYQNMITDKTDPFYNGFYVPENVYIIGTMNDIDRSVESMDFAMRRRFAWEEIKANENTGMLDELQEMKKEVVEVMERLNDAIWNEKFNTGIEGLNAAYHIGGSYFSKLKLYLDEDKETAYQHLWNNHLKGILFEYLRGTADAIENLKMLEKVYYNGNSNNDIEG